MVSVKQTDTIASAIEPARILASALLLRPKIRAFYFKEHMELKIDQSLKALIPPLAPDERKLLEDSILAEGCRDVIITWNDTIVDGHNRYEICTQHGVPFKVEDRDFESIDEVKVWMIDNQKGRRNLTDGWKFELAQERKKIIAEKGKEKQSHGLTAPNKTLLSIVDKSDGHNTRNEIAADLGWSTGKVAMADKVWKAAPAEVKEKVKAGEVSINEAYKEVKRSEKIQEQQERFIELKQKEISLPTGLYDVIVIDPPWEMEKIKRDVAIEQVGFDYPTMTIDEIKQFELPADKDCHVFMWITHKHLPMGFDILQSWGAKYVFTMVWHKNGGFQPFNLPQYNCEFVLYGKIGNPQFVDLKAFNTCFFANRTGHSAKPDEFYDLIRRVTAGRRIDIFNRRDIEGFDKWGNEA
jgi:N6-adenosine-specific RNA methylase IME4